MTVNVPSTASNGELVFIGTPFHVGRCTIDTQQNEGWLPDQLSSLCVGSLLPDVGVTILSGGDDTIRVGGPVDGGDLFIMLVVVCVEQDAFCDMNMR